MSDTTTLQGSTTRAQSFLERNLPFSLEVLIGIVVGGVAVVFLLCVAVACVCCRRSRQKKTEEDTKHLELEKRRSQKNNYLHDRVPADIGTEGHVDRAKKKLKRGNRLSFKVRDVLTNTLVKQMESYTIEEDRLKLGEVIGSGNFGIVYKAEMFDKNKEKSETVAVKTMQGEECSQKEVQIFLEEVLRMRGFHHKNVLSITGLSIVDDKPFAVLPFMDNGDLRTYLRDSQKDFIVKDMLLICSQVADGMTYLSEQGFIHRDLAARNCMVDKDGTVKIADFGLSRDLFTSDYYRMENMDTPLPVRWMAVECLHDKVFSHKSDVWSFGVFMWEVMTRGKNPYPDRDNLNVVGYVKSGGRPSRPHHVNEHIYSVMTSCWRDDPDDRPIFSQLSQTIRSLLDESFVWTPQYENIKEGKKAPSRGKRK